MKTPYMSMDPFTIAGRQERAKGVGRYTREKASCHSVIMSYAGALKPRQHIQTIDIRLNSVFSM